MGSTKKTAAIAYIPVLHRGYLDFLDTLQKEKIERLFLLDRAFVTDEFPLHKDIRALDATELKSSLVGHNFSFEIDVICELGDLDQLHPLKKIIMPEDEVMRWFAAEYLNEVQQVEWRDVFLRWDKKSSTTKKHVDPDATVTHEQLHRQLMARADRESSYSADWWRQIGAVLARDGEVLLTAHNHHLPDEQAPYYDGDPRGNFHKGEHIEVSTALHAEQALITEAARRGLSLEGTDIYVTTFPCPTCAKLLANTGVSRVFFEKGYSMINGAEIMEQAGIDLFRCEL